MTDLVFTTPEEPQKKIIIKWTVDPAEEAEKLEHWMQEDEYRPIFHHLREWVHKWAYRHRCHDAVIGSWGYRAWSKVKVKTPKAEQLRTLWAKDLSQKIQDDLLAKVNETFL